MSRCLPQNPTVTRSGTTKTASPPTVTQVSVALNPVASQFSGAVTVEPEAAP